ncbi:DUF1887 family protein [Desertifilum sp. FACHB-1129]|uniref:Card1-like endonuclease domain-containing protein n=1 Tax=unclassified Desertifilum TaxID=2621682 RepID=UPI00168364A2|nr:MULTISPECIES: DUF1887 family protein [unclassified Desertifilum]MBD2311103.1 DUF1887 family protein [Desertifilum sp. FACHB-1129]MBD2323970.1 DUF1887 family protein [Desertifilum sp. FACHB-866]MBD2333905.1 DUF1887 family protein [Desertifilum sp. FACHB-868]MDA0211216.1 DUF1887 family protein [Cyanobacteria bacterium FC1]
MSLSKFEQYAVNHLFLLVGENPLPNYVAARLLLAKGGTPHFIYTANTEETARRLAKILQNEPLNPLEPARMRSLEDGESDTFRIKEVVQQELDTITSGKIGINYTGGTKTMAVHAYRTLHYEKQGNSYQERQNIQFSYLDPRHLEMCIEKGNNLTRVKIDPHSIKVDLAKIFQIHGWAWLDKSKPIKVPESSEAAKAFASFHTNGDLVKEWRNWCNDILRENARNPKDKNKWKEEKKLQPLVLPIETVVSHESIKSALEVVGVKDNTLSLQKLGFSSLREACKWLDGEWLEHYVLAEVQAISSTYAIHESASSFWIRNPANTKQTKFQFDVAFMRGYQLFAISCTTIDSKFDCKSKLFEAYIRARQLGGDEARVALVCCADSKGVEALKTEIINVLQPSPDSPLRDHKLTVFGREDLLNLSNKLTVWIEMNDQDAK